MGCYKSPDELGRETRGHTGERNTTTNRTVLVPRAGLSGRSAELTLFSGAGRLGRGSHGPAACSRAGAACPPGAEGWQLPPGRESPGQRKATPGDL